MQGTMGALYSDEVNALILPPPTAKADDFIRHLSPEQFMGWAVYFL
jgi:hypothetical protein